MTPTLEYRAVGLLRARELEILTLRSELDETREVDAVNPAVDPRIIRCGEMIFAACVYGSVPPYRWLVWGPRAFQREGESASRLGAWERIESAVRYRAEIVGRR